MEPALANGQTIVAVRGEVKRSEIVIYSRPGSVDGVGRVIAIPGDRVEFKDEQVLVNGQADATNTKGQKTLKAPDSPLSNSFTLPAGQYLILGDNRGNSFDSRYSGLVQERDLKGKLLLAL
jgi:signal peptidase I